jgi:Tol biopolymer transport system component
MFTRLSIVLLTACGAAPDVEDAASALSPGATPSLVGPGDVSTGDDECHPTLSPDGRTLYFLKDTPSFDLYTIVETERRGGRWTRPRTVPFSGQWPDGDLSFAPDGRTAYFVSSRPVDGRPRTDMEIWTVSRGADGGWSEPRHVSELSAPGDEWFPIIVADGSIYFGSSRPGGLGGSDIWRAPRRGDGFGPPENLGAPINSPAEEVEAFVDRGQTFLVLAAKGRPDSVGAYDLYVSRRVGGAWQAPAHPGPPLNSKGWDFGPRFSPDGQLFFFASNRGFAHEPLAAPLTYDELERRLRAPGNGLRDIYVVDADVVRPR